MRKFCCIKHGSVCVWNVGYRAQNRVGCREQRGKVKWQLLNLCYSRVVAALMGKEKEAAL